jgi:hypothetical protein
LLETSSEVKASVIDWFDCKEAGILDFITQSSDIASSSLPPLRAL